MRKIWTITWLHLKEFFKSPAILGSHVRHADFI